MKPVSPAIPGMPVTVYAKDQPEYNPLPSHKSADGCVTTRWKLTWRERLDILVRGHFYLQVLTFNHPLQPVKLSTSVPDEFKSNVGQKA